MENLARKPRLTLVRDGETASQFAVDIIPELAEPLSEAGGHRWWRLDPERSRWLSSLGIVLLVYAAPLAGWLWSGHTPGAALPPPVAMVVELAPAPMAPPAPAEQPPGPEQTEATPPPPEFEPKPEPEPEVPPAPVAPEPEVALDPVEEPPVEALEPDEVSPPEPPEIIEETSPPDAPREDARAAAPNQGVPAPVVDRNRVMNWQSRLMMKLNDAKRYPAGARRSRQEGVAHLRFAMDREGGMLSASIERSSGYPLLDEETLALIERAQPLPKPPEDMPGESLEFVVPVEFILKR